MEVSLLHVMFNFFSAEVPIMESMSTNNQNCYAFISRYCVMAMIEVDVLYLDMHDSREFIALSVKYSY